ncbi:MAG: hypothetical protein ACTSRU_19510 [Candidatus Hodarchaeales archaeon]
MVKKRGRKPKVVCKVSSKELDKLFLALEKDNSVKEILSKLVLMEMEAIDDKTSWWMDVKDKYDIKSNNIFVSNDGRIYEYEDEDDLDDKLMGFFFKDVDDEGEGGNNIKEEDEGDNESYMRSIV